MMAILYRSLIYVVIIQLKESQPLKCWSCSSIFAPGCDDPFKPEDVATGEKHFVADCESMYKQYNGSVEEQELLDQILGPGAKPYCRKTVLKAYGTTIVHRGCSFGEPTKDCVDFPPEVCISKSCLEDACNGVSSVGRVALLLTLIILISTGIR